MDALELPLPVAVKLSNTIEDVEPRKSESFPILTIATVSRFSSSVDYTDGTNAGDISMSAYGNKILGAEPCSSSILPHKFLDKTNLSQEVSHDKANSSTLFLPGPDSKQQKQSNQKVFGGSNICKRVLMPEMEDSIEAGVDDVKVANNELGSSLMRIRSTLPERPQAGRQKSLNSKRGDRRNLKVPPKAKYDPFSLKAGLLAFNSAAGVNSILGAYGLKSDNRDVTKDLNDLSLSELLDGSYACPVGSKDKGKKATTLNENVLHSVRKACSLFELPRTQSPDGDNKTDATNLSSAFQGEGSCSMSETLSDMLDFPTYPLKDIMERLVLPPTKDLDSLLIDASKPAAPLRNNPDQRTPKAVSNRVCLPPFAWSHNYNAHFKTNSDVVKLSTSRNTCQGRWIRIANAASSLGGFSESFTNLESLRFDHSLIPLGTIKEGILGSESSPVTISVSLPSACVPPESGKFSLKYQASDGHSPRLLAAAQTLCDFATHSLNLNPKIGMIRWPRKHSQKAVKVRKLKSKEKPQDVFAIPKSSLAAPEDLIKSVDHLMPSKKAKLSVFDKRNDHGHTNNGLINKGPINWSTPKSSRSSPSKSSSSIVKHLCVVPPPPQPKMRKLLPMDWNRGRGKL